MQLTAKLLNILPLQTGTSKNGPWKKQEIIVEMDGNIPRKLCISVWGEKIDTIQLKIGQQLKIDFEVESREFNSKWYSEVKAWKIEVIGSDNAFHIENPSKDESDYLFIEDDIEDDMPF